MKESTKNKLFIVGTILAIATVALCWYGEAKNQQEIQQYQQDLKGTCYQTTNGGSFCR